MTVFIPATTVFRPDVTPYISIADYQNAPTAVDTSALVYGGNAPANLVELNNVIRRASSWANNLCDQILLATLDTQTSAGVRVRTDGTARVVCDFWPVLEVDSFSAGAFPSTLVKVTDFADMFLIGRKVLSVPVGGISSTSANNIGFPGPLAPGDRAYCQWTYWNGWPHSTLGASASAGATSLTFATTMPQALAGRLMTIWDGANTEQVTVAATFTGGTSIPLVSALLFAHALPAAPGSITVTTLPDDVRQAIISLTSALIKSRGAESYEMPAVGQEPAKSALIEGGGMEDLAVAVDLLDFYKRVA